MKLDMVSAKNLDPKIRKQCLALCMRRKGCMFHDLPYWGSKYPSRTHVLTLHDDSGKLLAWALVTPYYLYDWNTDKDNLVGKEFQVYTRASERRKGYAQKLYRKAYSRWGNMIVTIHDDPSRGFFKSQRAEKTKY